MRAARENNAIVSFDLNYRDSLWRTRGERPAANRLNRWLLANADVAKVFDGQSDAAVSRELNVDEGLILAWKRAAL